MKETNRLTPDQREQIGSYGARTSWPAGFTIYEQGAPADGLFIVLRGRVVLRSLIGGGRTFAPWMATAGETFGGEGLARDARYASQARADESSDTLHLSGAKLGALLREQPGHMMALLRQMMSEHAALLEQYGQHATLSVEQRLIAALARAASSTDGMSRRDAVPVVPRRLLGELVGATRESISLVLGRLAADGVIQRDGTGVMITDLARLRAKLQRGESAGTIATFDEAAVIERVL